MQFIAQIRSSGSSHDRLLPAVLDAGGEIVMIEDDKIISRLNVIGVSGNLIKGFIDKKLYDDIVQPSAKDPEKTTWEHTATGQEFQSVDFNFDTITGDFVMAEIESYHDYNAVMDRLKGIRVVSLNMLRWGMVPDTFKGVEKYQSACIES